MSISSVNDKIINECGVVFGTGRTEEKTHASVHHKSGIT
jgi:hypothetical protein